MSLCEGVGARGYVARRVKGEAELLERAVHGESGALLVGEDGLCMGMISRMLVSGLMMAWRWSGVER